MPWWPLPRVAFAVCIYPFTPSGPNDLPLQIGDELYIIEQGGKAGDWYRGYLLAQPSILAGLTSSRGQSLEKRVFAGIFPGVCVEIREFLGGGTPEQQVPPEVKESRHAKKPSTIQRKPVPQKTAARESKSFEEEEVEDDAASENSLVASGRDEFDLSDAEPEKNDSAVDTSTAPIRELSPESSELRYHRPKDGRPRPPAPVPMLKISDESTIAKDEPLVDEISSCLREWQSTRLHELLLNREYRLLSQMSTLVNRLDSARRQLLHRILTDSELDRLREQAVWDLSRGNKLLSGGVIVRSRRHRGRILTSDDSAVETTKLQAMMSLLDEKPTHQADNKLLYHLFMDLKKFHTDTEQPTWLEIALFSKQQGQAPKLLTEVFSTDAKNKSGALQTLDGEQRTLFTDIAGSDVGEGSTEQSNVFLVMKMITSEPPYRRRPSARTPPSTSGGPPISGSHSRINSALRTASVRNPSGGRQSLMWGRKARKDSDQSSQRPGPSRAETTPSGNVSRVEVRDNAVDEAMKHQKPLKRVVAFGILNVSRHIKNMKPLDTRVQIRPVATLFEDGSLGDDDERQVALEAVGLVSPLRPVHTRGFVVLHLRSFQNASAADLIQRTPTLFHSISTSNRLGFAGAPRKPRNDIYLTLRKPNVLDGAVLSHPTDGNVPIPSDVGLANMILTLEVHRSDGRRIPNAIWPSSSRSGHDAWRTYATEQNASWNQTIRLSVDDDHIPGCHIVMSLAEGHLFPFALCWMPLWRNNAFMPDGSHSLLLHRYDDTTSAMRDGVGAYLNLGWQAPSRDEAVTGRLASLQVDTYLCSTSFSQDPNLVGLLHWNFKEQQIQDHMALLQNFHFVGEIETVKMLKDVFNALFGIMVEYSTSSEVSDVVFEHLVSVLGIAHDRRFDLQPIVDEYVKNNFRFPFAFPCLLQSWCNLLDDPANPSKSRQVRATLKVGAHLLKFMVKSRQQQVQKEAEIGISSHRPTFAKDLSPLFAAFENLIRNEHATLVGTKTLLVQNFHTILPELRSVMNSEEILTIASKFINCVSAEAKGKLILYELLLIQHISDADLFPAEDAQQEWISNIHDWLFPHWGTAETYTAQWRDQTRLCCSVIATLYDKYGSRTTMWIRKLIASYKVIQSMPRTSSHVFTPLFPTSYPFPSKTTKVDAKYDEALLEISALLSASSTLTAREYPKRTIEDLTEGLLGLLHVSKSILDSEAFPENWLSAHIYHHRSCLRFLQSLFEVLTTKFLPEPDDAENFNDALWRSYLELLIQLVSSKAIALETFSEQRRRAIWKICGDIREPGADLLLSSWQALGWESDTEMSRYGLSRVGGYQVSFTPGMIGYTIALCLNVHEGLRSKAIQILHSMIIGEWDLNASLDAIKSALITNIEKLYKTEKLHDGTTQKLFIEELRSCFMQSGSSSDEKLMTAMNELLYIGSELLERLVAVYSPDTPGGAHQIYQSMRLLEYFRALHEQDIYIQYIHRISDTHAENKDFLEAGLALQLHADVYIWDLDIPLNPLSEPALPAQSSFARKEHLCLQMIRYYEEARAWQHAIQIYDELAHEYEHYVYDFSKLARAQRAKAAIYDKIAKGDYPTSRFFRVQFRGLGFTTSVRDKQFIYEAEHNERLAAFTDKMQKQYPNAHMIGVDEPDEWEGQYLSIFAINPQRDLAHSSNRKPGIPQPIKDFFMSASPERFANTTRKHPGNASVRAQIQEKTVYTTAQVFPNIERRSEIVHVEVLKMPPEYIGTERAMRKTTELRGLTHQAQEGTETVMSALTDVLMHLVDESSPACIAAYWELLEDDLSEENSLEEETLWTKAPSKAVSTLNTVSILVSTNS